MRYGRLPFLLILVLLILACTPSNVFACPATPDQEVTIYAMCKAGVCSDGFMVSSNFRAGFERDLYSAEMTPSIQQTLKAIMQVDHTLSVKDGLAFITISSECQQNFTPDCPYFLRYYRGTSTQARVSEYYQGKLAQAHQFAAQQQQAAQYAHIGSFIRPIAFYAVMLLLGPMILITLLHNLRPAIFIYLLAVALCVATIVFLIPEPICVGINIHPSQFTQHVPYTAITILTLTILRRIQTHMAKE